MLLLGLLAACAEAPRQAFPASTSRPLGWVDVRLATAGSLTLGCEGAVQVLDPSGGVAASIARLGGEARASLAGGRVRLADNDLGPPPVELRPQGALLLRLSGKPYRGLFRIEAAEGRQLRVVNRLPVEDYLRGVLPSEMPDRFGLEALKAQAVAARSYALAEVGQRGWLHPDQRSQVYGGAGAESWLADQAVATTAGEVMTVGGKVVSTWFHSTCGGGTTPAREVFPAAPAGYLDRAVSCPDCRHSPFYEWERRVPAERVCEAVGLPSAALTSVEGVPARFPGRPGIIRVEAGGRSASLDPERFRARISAGLPRDEQLLSTRWARQARVEGGALVVTGHGWGHGVGLCQYGAGGYAARGAGYRAILARYYIGAELVDLW